MLNLLKYEIYKRHKSIFVAIILVALAELLCIYYINVSWQSAITKGALVYFVLGFAGLIFVLIDNLNTFYSDLTKKTGYMLFLTPQNSYKILLSKTLVAFTELICGFLLYFGLGLLNYQIAASLYNQTSVFNFLNDVIIPISLNASSLFNGLLFLVLIWFNFILTFYLSMTIYKSLFSNAKHNGIFTFIFFMIVNVIAKYIYTTSYSLLFGSTEIAFLSPMQIAAFSFILLLTSTLFFFLTGYLLDKKVNF